MGVAVEHVLLVRTPGAFVYFGGRKWLLTEAGTVFSAVIGARVPRWLIALPAALLLVLVAMTLAVDHYLEMVPPGRGATGRRTHYMLLIGLPLDVLITAVVLQLAMGRWRRYVDDQGHVAALESLARISAAISGRIGQGEEVLGELAESARKLLDMVGQGSGWSVRGTGR